MALASNALLPLVYWYGHPEIKRNPLLMDRLIRNLGENMNDRFEHDPEGVLSMLPTGRQSFALIDGKFIFAN
jgi:polyribonucleotide 5'-hydroxyl-kinase